MSTLSGGGVRVAYLTPMYPGLSHTFVQREVEALRRRGVTVETISIRRATGEHLLSEAHRREAATTYAVLPPDVCDLLRAHGRALARHPRAYVATLRRALALAPPGARGRLWQLFYFAEAMLVWRHCVDRDVSHVHAHLAIVSADVALLAAEFGQRSRALGRTWSWSFTMHGPTEFYDVGRHRLAAKAEDASFVACISDFARSQLMGLLDEREWPKLTVVHCGLRRTEDADARSRPAGTNENLVILNIGRLVPEKGQAILLDAVAELATRGTAVRTVIVGSGERHGALERHARRRGIADRVEFTGPLGQDAIGELYETADVFCLPSFAEGVPVVLMEAMAKRLPVVATMIMGVPELVTRECGVLVPPGRPDALADALERLLTDPGERRRLGVAAQARVRAEFDIDESAARLEELFAATPGASTAAPGSLIPRAGRRASVR